MGYRNETTTQLVSWSPDGRKIADLLTQFRPYQESIYIANADGKNAHEFEDKPNTTYSSIHWSPDGRHILYVESRSSENDQIIRQTENGRMEDEILLPPNDRLFVYDVSWMGNRYLLISVVQDGVVESYDILRYKIATGEFENLTNSPRDNETGAVWIDDSPHAISTADKLTLKWDNLSNLIDSEEVRLLTIS